MADKPLPLKSRLSRPTESFKNKTKVTVPTRRINNLFETPPKQGVKFRKA